MALERRLPGAMCSRTGIRLAFGGNVRRRAFLQGKRTFMCARCPKRNTPEHIRKSVRMPGMNVLLRQPVRRPEHSPPFTTRRSAMVGRSSRSSAGDQFVCASHAPHGYDAWRMWSVLT